MHSALMTAAAGGPSGLGSGCGPALIRGSKSSSRPVLALLGCGLAASSTVLAQAPSRNELSQYTAAVAHVQIAERVRQLKRFATTASPGPLRADALEFIIFGDLRRGNRQDAWQWASMLQAADSENPVALGMVTDHARSSRFGRLLSNDSQLSMSKVGLGAIPHMRRPLGMSENDFALLSRQTQAMLKGSAGDAELQRRNYLQARQYLRDAVALDPNNVQNVYALGLADIDGKPSAAKEGYMYLARAVALSRGTPEGVRMAQFARDRYVHDGGSTENWDQFLAAAGQPNALSPQESQVARNLTSTPPKAHEQAPEVVAASRSPAVSPPPKAKSTPSVWADDTLAASPVPRKHAAPNTNGPVSLGILIETSLTTKENRSAVLNGLSDMLRHLGDQDEAFILSYDNNLVFTEDLTTDPAQLEEAMKDIRPQKGAVLDDAVAFAAGHLARIAKYPHRVLLVVSDGRNIDSSASPMQTSAEINAAGVKIYCIGMDVEGQDGRYRLQALSSGTGGYSNFISGPQQFRSATLQIAKNMGIDFRF
jgi:hypothetical protein